MLNLRLASQDSIERAIALFEQALELDPNYVEALIALGGRAAAAGIVPRAAHAVRAQHGARAGGSHDPAGRRRRAHAAGRHAPVDGTRRRSDCRAHGRPAAAARQGAGAQHAGARVLARPGQLDEAIARVRAPPQLESRGRLHPLAARPALRAERRLRAAEELAREAIACSIRRCPAPPASSSSARTPGSATCTTCGALRRGDPRVPARARDAVGQRSSPARPHDHRGAAEAGSGLPAERRRRSGAPARGSRRLELFEARLAAGGDEPFTRYYIAALYAMRGDVEARAEHLERPLQDVPAFTRWRLPRDPDFAGVRADLALERDGRLIADLKSPQAHAQSSRGDAYFRQNVRVIGSRRRRCTCRYVAA